MAIEKWTVLYSLRDGGAQGPANWAEGAVVAQGKNKNRGLSSETGAINWNPTEAKVVTIEAESAEEAAQALRVFYGQGTVTGPFLVAKSANLSEVKPQS